MNKFLICIFIVLTAIGCQKKEVPDEEVIDAKRLGQMVIIGFRGTEVNNDHPVIRDLKERNIGGVILYDFDRELESFDRNIKSQDQLLKLSSDLISNATTPPIISVEQDGGTAAPLDDLYSNTTEKFSSNFLQDSASTVEYSRKFAQEFMVLGLNTNFNPRLDLQTPSANAPKPEIISSDPNTVSQQAGYILDEYDKERMFSVPKYFPGYSSDYHSTDLNNDVTDSWNKDFLQPYKILLSEREIHGIMTSHSFNAQIDSVWPGTLSHKTITGLLRDSLEFEGVIISDDMQKPIIAYHYDMETAIAQALNAGVDILLFGNNFEYDENLAEKVIQSIQNVLKDGRVSKDKVEASLARIEKLKQDVIAELCTCFNF